MAYCGRQETAFQLVAGFNPEITLWLCASEIGVVTSLYFVTSVWHARDYKILACREMIWKSPLHAGNVLGMLYVSSKKKHTL